MARPFLSAFVMWSIGCVIPTPIGSEAAGGHHTPIITGGDPDFKMGTVVHLATDAWSFTVHAEDDDGGTANGPQVLQAQMYFKSGDRFDTYTMIVMGVADPKTPTQYTGSFGASTGVEFCPFLQAATKDQDKYVYVYVADAAFPDKWDPSQTPPDSFAGHFDYKYWVVNCD